MAFTDFESEDIALVASIAIATIAAIIDTIYGSLFFKALKIIGLILSFGLAIHRIRTSKPYYKDVTEHDWIERENNTFEFQITKTEHKRGKFPHSRCLVPGISGGYTECLADAEVGNNGTIVVQINRPGNIRIEVRK